jgi:hypothetical protein
MRWSGTEIEEEVLGHALVVWDGAYLPFGKSLELVKAHQPCDPSDPEAGFANDLHASVALALGLEDWSELKLFTAVGSPLDFFHGVDAFFELRGKIVTIDVTINPNKCVAKADMVLNVSDLETALMVGAPAIKRLLERR